jgi:hypothetical protein
MFEQDKLLDELKRLKDEHRNLDALIANTSSSGECDQLQIQRLKKRKLWVKDRMAEIESALYDDIIA